MPRIGIPRALLYYQYYPLWSAFFQGMGLEVVLSEPTSKAIMAAGSLRVVAETCLPVKVYCGHVTDLIGKCDYIFIPAIRSIQKNVYNCSKFLGLPDLIKAVIPRCPTIIDVDIDASKGKVGLHPSTYDIGRWIQPKPKGQKEAAQHAWQVHLDYQETLKTRGITPIEYLVHDQGNYDSHHCERSGAISTPLRDCSGLQPRNDIARNPCGGIPGDRDYAPPTQTPAHLTIAVIGHPYNIYDDFITHRILHRLNSLGARVVTPEIAGRELLAAGVEKVVGKPYWTYEDEIVGAGGHYLDSEVDGVIAVVSFGCGPDSTMIDVVQRYARRPGAKPLLTLTIDEHTGEAGMVTRLEAFLDMVVRKAKRKS